MQQRKKPTTKLSHIPSGSWYISKMELNHAQLCPGTAVMTTEFLLEHPGFRGAILPGHSTSLARVVKTMSEIHGVDISKQPAMAYRTITQAKKQNPIDPVAEYGRLPSYLREFARKNPGSRVCCQLDSEGRAVNVQDAFLPVWECDGTHMKDPSYNGICLTIIGKDGNKQNVPIAVAYVHKETIDNFAWFFGNCIVAGIKLNIRPAFCDRGKQLAAQALLLRINMKIHLKFCTLHIRFNTMDKFKSLRLNLKSVNDDIFSLQGASTTEGYELIKNKIASNYPAGISKVVAEKFVEEQVWSYLCSIHPTDWCVVGNMKATTKEIKWIEDNWSSVPKHGDALPLFGIRTTSAVEGENNGLLWGRVRTQLVLRSVMTYCTRALKVLQKRKELVQEWNSASCDITPHALKEFEKEKELVAHQTDVQRGESIFYVFDAFDSRGLRGDAHLYEVNMDCGTCTRCTVAEQMQVPCRHMQAVAFWRSRQTNSELPAYDIKHYFHEAYTVSKMVEAFDSTVISLPLFDELEQTNEVKPPPLYRQAGQSRKRSKEARDFETGKRRTPNRGECAGTTAPIVRQCVPRDVHSDDDSKAIAEFFSLQVKGARRSKRETYTCSRCQEAGHNVRSCTTPLMEIEEAGVSIVPGIYVVGECPFVACGKSEEYEREINTYK
ncbi:hypothetical protein DVH05_023686 [Phytophthora capsici]|nr:hypothetical protein DVH05_023686 [Phytophthora capsici]